MSDAAPLDPFVVSGHPLHTRSLVVDVLQERQGAIRAEGVILDLRKCGFVPTGGELQTAGFIHHMELGAHIDLADRRLTALETRQPTVAFEPTPATGGDCCRDPAPRLQALVGEMVDAGFAKRVAGVFGGALGCSHLMTLAQLMGRTLPRMLDEEDAAAARADGERIAKRALFVEGFEAEEGMLDIAIQSASFRTRPHGEVTQPLERLAASHDVRVLGRVRLADMQLESLDAAERRRTLADVATAPWVARTDDVAALAGAPALGGLAGRCFEAFGQSPDDATLLDTLLQLAPGLIQCLAALSNRILGMMTAPADQRPAEMPKELSVGGFPDSCYMWRADGSMARTRFTPPGG
jgi:hypothetical protein